MAFNPFRGFRKHQKVIMASMVFIAMVTFVLCSGAGAFTRGDFAGWFQSTFMGRGRVTEIAKVYGKAIDYPELEQLHRQRKLANDYMGLVGFIVTNKVVSKARDPKLDQRVRSRVVAVLDSREGTLRAGQNPRIRSMSITGLLQDLQEYTRFLDEAQQNIKDKPAERDLLEDLKVVLRIDAAAIVRGPNRPYFGGTFSNKELLDFMIWRHQA